MIGAELVTGNRGFTMSNTNQPIILSTDGYHDFKSQAWLLAADCAASFHSKLRLAGENVNPDATIKSKIAALPYKLTHIYNLAANVIGHKTLNGIKCQINDDGGCDKVFLRDFIVPNSSLGELIVFCNAWESLALYGPKSTGFEHLSEYTDKGLLGLAEYLSLCDEDARVQNWSENNDNMYGIVEVGDGASGVNDVFHLEGSAFPDLVSLDVACCKALISERKKFAEIYL